MSNLLEFTDEELQEICVIFYGKLSEVKNPDFLCPIKSVFDKADQAFTQTELYKKIAQRALEVH